NHGHAAGIENIEGRSQDLATKFLSTADGSVGAFDGNVKIPVRWNAVRGLVRPKGARGSRVASLKLENRVDLVGADGIVRESPGEDLGIEVFCSGLVVGGELDPAKVSGSVFFDVSHSSASVLLKNEGDKMITMARRPSVRMRRLELLRHPLWVF